MKQSIPPSVSGFSGGPSVSNIAPPYYAIQTTRQGSRLGIGSLIFHDYYGTSNDHDQAVAMATAIPHGIC